MRNDVISGGNRKSPAFKSTISHLSLIGSFSLIDIS